MPQIASSKIIDSHSRSLLAAVLFLVFSTNILRAQSPDNRCELNANRAWWDVQHYDLNIDFDLDKRKIKGHNIIQARVLVAKQSILQIDLQSPLRTTQVYLWQAKNKSWESIPYNEISNGILVMIPFAPYGIGDTFSIKVMYEGQPQVAQNAPWDGGMVFSKDAQKRHFVGVACQGLGASAFYPLKDVLADEPDHGMMMTYTVPQPYQVIGNGKLLKTFHNKLHKTTTVQYQVVNPINSYGVSFYIGRYGVLSSDFTSEAGRLPLKFHHLAAHKLEASRLFATIPGMIQALEYWCGAYPFPQDGISFVEAPYLGMEHQSAIAYGNGFKNGYKGKDRSGSGVGMLFDFIALHELAHEWYGNNISIANPCDMWINEGFTTYLESLYVEYAFGKDEADLYRIGKQKIIQNKNPARGDCNSCKSGSGDQYDKAAAMIHNLRLVMNDDEKFRSMLRSMNATFRHRVIGGREMIPFLQSYFDINIEPILSQYLDHTSIPKLDYEISNNNQLSYKWTQCIETFNMPIWILIDDERVKLSATTTPQVYTHNQDIKQVRIPQVWYVAH